MEYFPPPHPMDDGTHPTDDPTRLSSCVASKIFLITCVRAKFCAASVAFQGFGFLGHTFAFFIRSLYFEMQIIPSRPRLTCENRNHCSRRLCPPGSPLGVESRERLRPSRALRPHVFGARKAPPPSIYASYVCCVCRVARAHLSYVLWVVGIHTLERIFKCGIRLHEIK